jgi:hypothetical protein
VHPHCGGKGEIFQGFRVAQAFLEAGKLSFAVFSADQLSVGEEEKV